METDHNLSLLRVWVHTVARQVGDSVLTVEGESPSKCQDYPPQWNVNEDQLRRAAPGMSFAGDFVGKEEPSGRDERTEQRHASQRYAEIGGSSSSCAIYYLVDAGACSPEIESQPSHRANAKVRTTVAWLQVAPIGTESSGPSGNQLRSNL